MIIEVQCLPTPSGTTDDHYRHIEAAIAVIEASGLRHEVSALGTTFEGSPDACWSVARAAHEACLVAGADSVVTIVKVAESGGAGRPRPSIDSLTSKYRS